MEKVMIHKWATYDGDSDTMRISRRWATREAAERFGAVIESSAVEVDASAVRTDIEGMTIIGFDPHPREPGFQRR